MFNRKEQTALLLLGAALLLGSGLVAVDYFRPSAMEEFRVIPAAVAPPEAEVAQTVQTTAQTVAQPATPRGEPPAALPVQAGPVDVNRATADELQRLPGIGPKIAARILAYREEHGPFATVDALAKVKGIGPRTVAKVKPLVVCGPATKP